MLDWIKKHPYITGSLAIGLVILYIILRGNSSSSPQVVQTGPSDALQAADLQAQVQQQAIQTGAAAQSQQLDAALAAKQIDAATALAQQSSNQQVALKQLEDQTQIQTLAADIQKQQITAQQDVATQSINAQLQEAQFASIDDVTKTQAAISIAGIQSAAQVSLGEAQINGQVQIAGLQADVAKLSITDQLAGLKDTNATQINLAQISSDLQKFLSNNATGLATLQTTDAYNLGYQKNSNDLALGLDQDLTARIINASNNSTLYGITQLNDATASHLSDNQLLGLLNNNSTALSIAGLNTSVQLHGIDVLGGVYNNLITTSGQVAITQSNNASLNFTSLLNSLTGLTAGGVFNKGGEGGANQVQIWTSIFGTPQTGALQANPINTLFAGIPQDLSAIFGKYGVTA